MQNRNSFNSIQIFLGIVIISFVSSFGFSQESTNNERVYHSNLVSELQGVYQIQLDNPRLKPMVSTDLLEEVQRRQHQNKSITFDYKSMRVFVISKDDELAGKLIPESQFVVAKH